tara:strand:+ start:1354 stop:1560 length:207 start_codon:yes stop_codon:yes gene_type:complete
MFFFSLIYLKAKLQIIFINSCIIFKTTNLFVFRNLIKKSICDTDKLVEGIVKLDKIKVPYFYLTNDCY